MSESKQLTRSDVVLAGLDTLDAYGLDKMTMRLVADRLGVRLNTVYWHAKSKAVLLDLMADELLAGITEVRLPREWRKRVKMLARRYRNSLLSRRDGGRLSIARFEARTNTVLLSEALHGAFVAGGFDPATVSHASWTVSYITLASAVEQQGEPSGWEGGWSQSSAALHGADLIGQSLQYSISGNHRDRFEFGIDCLLAGLDGLPLRDKSSRKPLTRNA